MLPQALNAQWRLTGSLDIGFWKRYTMLCPDSTNFLSRTKSCNVGGSDLPVISVLWHFYGATHCGLGYFLPNVSFHISVFSLLTFSSLKQKLKRERTYTYSLCNSLYFFLWQSVLQIIVSFLLWSPWKCLPPCASNGLLDLQEKQLTMCIYFPGQIIENNLIKKINKCLIAWHQQRFPLTLHP